MNRRADRYEFIKSTRKSYKHNNAVDFDDLICLTVELFKNNPDVLESYQDRLRYIMVDEYQDTNTAQFMLGEPSGLPSTKIFA